MRTVAILFWCDPSGSIARLSKCYVSRWKKPELDKPRAEYEQVRDALSRCLADTKSTQGRDYLSFLINRLDCTSLHLQAMAKLTELNAICAGSDPEKLDASQRAQAAPVFDQAFALIDQYLHTHAAAIVDRGCEGTLISYYHTVWHFTAKLKTKLLGEPRP